MALLLAVGNNIDASFDSKDMGIEGVVNEIFDVLDEVDNNVDVFVALLLARNGNIDPGFDNVDGNKDSVIDELLTFLDKADVVEETIDVILMPADGETIDSEAVVNDEFNALWRDPMVGRVFEV